MSRLKDAILFIRFTGLRHFFRILRNSIRKSRLDRPYLRATKAAMRLPWINPGKLVQTIPIQNGACFRFENASLEVVFFSPDMARLSWEPGVAPPPYALLEKDWPGAQVALFDQVDCWRLSSSKITIMVKLDGSFRFLDSQGRLIRDELPPLHKKTALQFWTSQARLQPDEHIFGLGEQAGPFNLRNTQHLIWNTDAGGNYAPRHDPLYMPLPVYIGLHEIGSYLIFYENSSRARFDFTPSIYLDLSTLEISTDCLASFESGMLRYYFIIGEPNILLERFTGLTGRAPLPPLWSLGYHQSRWGYDSEAEIRRVVEGFQRHQLPLSAIHLDIDYMDGYRVFTVDKDRFPALEGLAHELASTGVKLVVILDPGVKQDPTYRLYNDGLEQGHFCSLPDGKPVIGVVWPGDCTFPDFTDAEARRWWGEQYQTLLDVGVAGIWHDMNEPSNMTAWGDLTLPIATRHNLDGHPGDHGQAHNLYGLLMNRAGFEALQRLMPQRRPWLLSRSGWISNQRYAWNWGADCQTSWSNLHMTIAQVLGLGLSGQPFCGPDIGGFSGEPNAELYLRWFQMATFLPFFRTHSAKGTAPREPWVFGEPYTSILRRFLVLRYQLLPYLYTLAWQASISGCPIIRPLWWLNPQDVRLWQVDDAFLLGDALLVVPVLEPGAISRSTILPDGEWYNFWDGTPLQAVQNASFDISPEFIPLLVRAGSLLPLDEDGVLALHVYPSLKKRDDSPTSLAGVLYSDTGDGYGAQRLDRFFVFNNSNLFEIRRESEGDYPFPFRGLRVYLHGRTPQKVSIDGKQVSLMNGYAEAGNFTRIQFEV